MGTYRTREKTNFHQIFIDDIQNIIIGYNFFVIQSTTKNGLSRGICQVEAPFVKITNVHLVRVIL